MEHRLLPYLQTTLGVYIRSCGNGFTDSLSHIPYDMILPPETGVQLADKFHGTAKTATLGQTLQGQILFTVRQVLDA